MNEKRFTLFGLDNETIKDDVTKECYWVNEYVQRKKLVDLLNDQQATICKLQDLCGESDGENAKLRIENKRLQAENEKLRKELDDE